MKLRMDPTLRFWADLAYADVKPDHPNLTKHQLFAEILRQYEQRGDAMRYLNAKGKVAWQLSPAMLCEGVLAEIDKC